MKKRFACAGMAVAAVLLAGFATLATKAAWTAHETLQRLHVAYNIHDNISVAIFQYANEHDHRLPDTLGELVTTEDLDPKSLVVPWGKATVATGGTAKEQANQINSGGHCSFVYTGAGLRAGEDITNVVILYDDDGEPPGGSTLCLFGDGHSETMTAAQLMKDVVAPLMDRCPSIHYATTQSVLNGAH